MPSTAVKYGAAAVAGTLVVVGGAVLGLEMDGVDVGALVENTFSSSNNNNSPGGPQKQDGGGGFSISSDHMKEAGKAAEAAFKFGWKKYTSRKPKPPQQQQQPPQVQQQVQQSAPPPTQPQVAAPAPTPPVIRRVANDAGLPILANLPSNAVGFTCDLCHVPFSADQDRCRCLVCLDYDVCEPCFAKVGTQHPGHHFVYIAGRPGVSYVVLYQTNFVVRCAGCNDVCTEKQSYACLDCPGSTPLRWCNFCACKDRHAAHVNEKGHGVIIEHRPGFECDGCRRDLTDSIPWWKCNSCADYGLCTFCVGKPLEDHRLQLPDHTFHRTEGVALEPRMMLGLENGRGDHAWWGSLLNIDGTASPKLRELCGSIFEHLNLTVVPMRTNFYEPSKFLALYKLGATERENEENEQLVPFLDMLYSYCKTPFHTKFSPISGESEFVLDFEGFVQDTAYGVKSDPDGLYRLLSTAIIQWQLKIPSGYLFPHLDRLSLPYLPDPILAKKVEDELKPAILKRAEEMIAAQGGTA